MSVSSLRDYLDRLEANDDLVRISEPVSWNLEASGVTTMTALTDEAVPVFESVAEAGPAGARLVGDPYRGPRGRPWDRVATALDLPTGLDREAYYETVIDRLQGPIEPEVVGAADAPCKEVVHIGGDADLLEFPWPYLHAGDGGRYSNLHTLIAPDLDSDWTDWSYHRAMIHTSETASVLFLAGEQTPNLFYYGYERRGEPMPVAIAVGAEPAAYFTSVMWIPTGRDEAGFAGGLKGEPVELVDCETSDLRVPATAELVIEGTIEPHGRLDEGPFGDYFGYMHGPRRSMPFLTVDAITHRDRPILPFCVEGIGVGHNQNTTTTMELACVGPDATLGLRAAGFDVRACAPWPFTPRTVYTVATETPSPGYLHELANFIFTTWGMLHVDFFVFVDAHVDPYDAGAVLRAIALHADPDADFHQFGLERMPKVPLNIYQTPEEKGDVETGTSKTRTAKAYIDATAGEGEQALPLPGPEDDRRAAARRTLREAGLDLPVDWLADDQGGSP